MVKKKKLLIGFLVTGALLLLVFGGCWIWNKFNEKPPAKTELKTCSVDSDCILVETIEGLDYIPSTRDRCGCLCVTAINKKFEDLWRQKKEEFIKRKLRCDIMCKLCGYTMKNSRAECEKNQCIVKPKREKVIITTDKTEYAQGGDVKVTVNNGLNFSIHVDYWKGSWIIFQYKDGEWNEIFFGSAKTLPLCLCEDYPDGNCPLWAPPLEKFDEIESSETAIWSWDQKILEGTDKNCLVWIDASPGTYKVGLRHFYTLDPNKREWEIVYSSEFTILKSVSMVNCAEKMEHFLSKAPGSFESAEKGIKWCNECFSRNGIPALSYDIGPFCNLRTSDIGKVCTDSNQCEGICLAENENSKSGKCSETESVLGCVFEMTNGKSLEICFD